MSFNKRKNEFFEYTGRYTLYNIYKNLYILNSNNKKFFKRKRYILIICVKDSFFDFTGYDRYEYLNIETLSLYEGHEKEVIEKLKKFVKIKNKNCETIMLVKDISKIEELKKILIELYDSKQVYKKLQNDDNF